MCLRSTGASLLTLGRLHSRQHRAAVRAARPGRCPKSLLRAIQFIRHCASREGLIDVWGAGLLALGHLHGVSTAKPGEQSDLDVARDLMTTCNELYRRTPAGLAPEIAFFSPHSAGDVVAERHAGDVGGSDFTVKPQVWQIPDLQPHFMLAKVCWHASLVGECYVLGKMCTCGRHLYLDT